jgi:hypothetical protein
MCCSGRTSGVLAVVGLVLGLCCPSARADDNPYLANVLNSNDNDILRESIQHFVDNNDFPDDDAFINRLTAIIDNQNLAPSVREVSAFVLGKERDRAAASLPALERALELHSCREPKTTELGACWKLQRAAAEAIGRIHQSTPDAMSSLAQAQLHSQNAAVRAAAIVAQGELKGGSEEIRFLTVNLDAPENTAEIKSTIAYRLAQYGPKAAEAVTSLANALNNTDEALVQVSAWALGLIGPVAEDDSRIPLMGLVRDKRSANIRRVAATALQQIVAENDENHRHEVVQLLYDALKVEPDLDAKTAMAVTIGDLEDEHAAGAGVLFAALRSTDDKALQQALCVGIAKGSPPAGQDVTILTNDVTILTNVGRAEYPDVKIAAFNAIGHIHQQPNIAIPALLSALAPSDNIKDVRIAAIDAMGRFSDLGGHADEAIRSLAVNSKDPRTRLVAIRALESIGDAYRNHFANSTDRRDFTLEPAFNIALANVQDALTDEPLNNDYKQSRQSLASVLDALYARHWRDRMAFLKPFSWPLTLGLLYALWISIVYLVILRTRPLTLLGWNEFLAGLGQVEVFRILALKVRDVLLWNSYTDPRLLTAWIEKHGVVAKETFAGQYLSTARSVFLPLPVAVGENNDECVKADALQTYCSQESFLIRVIGEGGSGKTTIAYQLALRALEKDVEQRLVHDRLMIPVVLERVADVSPLKDVTAFNLAVRGKLKSTIRSADVIPEWLCDRLLRDRRILVIVDGLSEMTSPADAPLPLEADFPAAALIVTSRHSGLWETVPHVDMRPLRIDSNHLTIFMNKYLGEQKMLSDEKLYKACQRLASMAGKKGITPLLARMFAEQLEERTTGLPENVPDVVVGYVEALNAKRAPDQPAHPAILRAAERAAWECCRDKFSSGYVRRDRLSETLSACDGVGQGYLEFLENQLHLIRNIPPTYSYVEFSFDPVAEYLAGLWLARNLDGEQAWSAFLHEASEKWTESSSVWDFLRAVAECVRYIDFEGAPLVLRRLDALTQGPSSPLSAKQATV